MEVSKCDGFINGVLSLLMDTDRDEIYGSFNEKFYFFQSYHPDIIFLVEAFKTACLKKKVLLSSLTARNRKLSGSIPGRDKFVSGLDIVMWVVLQPDT